jgi:hypothetical protein
MPYTKEQSKTYDQAPEVVTTATLGAVDGLQGKVKEQKAGRIVATFNKTIHGKVLGDRTQFEIEVSPSANGGSQVDVTAYPIDPVGAKLMFGARKGVTETVITWFWAHLEHRLP